MLMLAFVFQTLAMRKPDLDAGVYAYAKAGFGEYLGFFSAFGYWASACVGNVTYWVLIMSTVGAIVPALGDGDTRPRGRRSRRSGIWVFYLLIRRGVKEAAAINRIVTIAKVVPILVFVVLALFYLDPQVFADNFSGDDDAAARCSTRSSGTMLVTVFVFLGVEGASVYSRHAEAARGRRPGHRPRLPQRASRLRLGHDRVLRHPAARARSPSCASRRWPACWRRRSGSGAAVFVSVGLIVSVLGAYLAWTLMAAEVLFVAAKDDDMPRFLGAAERGRRAGAGAADDHRADPGHAGRHAVLRGRVQLRARPDQRARR